MTNPNLLRQTASDRYESMMDQLLNYVEEWYGAVNLKALRILLAAAFHHKFTKEPPIWIWAHCPPRKIDEVMGSAIGQCVPAHGMVTFANTLRSLKEPENPLWFVHGLEQLFYGRQRNVHNIVWQLAGFASGKYQWKGFEPFLWQGRMTMIASIARPLDRGQKARLARYWPLIQNRFTTIRFEEMGIVPESFVQNCQKFEWNQKKIFRDVKQMFINLMDEDHRDLRHEVKVPEGLFDDLSYVVMLVKCLRGPGFDTELLLNRAISLSLSHAYMMGKSHTDVEDKALSRKVLIDSIPPEMVEFLRVIPLDDRWSLAEAYILSKQPRTLIREIVDTLVGVGSLLVPTVITRGKHRGISYYSVSPELQRVLLGGL